MKDTRRVWLGITYTVPAKPSKARVYIWRKLKELGAEYYHGMAMVPESPKVLESVKKLTTRIRELGAEVSVLEIRFLDPRDEEKVVAQFKRQAANDFRELFLDFARLYEELGGVWKLEQLNDLGLKKEQARLVQLSFQVSFDAARKEYIDKGYWVDVDDGQIVHTCNYRPVKALKYVKQEDSCFGLLRIPVLSYYPGTTDRRVRWESASYEDIPETVYTGIMENAYRDLPTAMKAVKNEIKNTLSQGYCPVLVSYEEIGMVKVGPIASDGGSENREAEKEGAGREEETMVYAMRDHSGNRVKLRSPEGMEDTVSMIPLLPHPSLYREGVLFGLAYYDSEDRQMGIHPCSVIKEDGIYRLLY